MGLVGVWYGSSDEKSLMRRAHQIPTYDYGNEEHDATQ